MRFQVPQFINIEDRIGPLTIKQYIYVAGGAGMMYIAYKFLPLYLGVFIIAPVALLALALAFLKINNKPFIFTLQAAIVYLFSNRLYLWKRAPKKMEARAERREARQAEIPALSESKLKDLTWALDINQRVRKK